MKIAASIVAILAFLSVPAWAQPGLAEPRIQQVAAAISLAQKAVGTSDAVLLTAAAEMLHASAAGGDDLLTGYVEEARFLARGDRGLLARLDALAPRDGQEAKVIVQTIRPGQSGVSAPRGTTAMGLYPPLPGGDGEAATCAGGVRALLSICDPSGLKDYQFERGGYAIFLMSVKSRQ